MKSVEEDSSSEDETNLSNLHQNIAKLNADLNLLNAISVLKQLD